MDFDIREICDYYDSELLDYDYDDLIRLGISHDNADFMVSIGVPEEYDDIVFYGEDTIHKTLIEGITYIKIGHFGYIPHGLYVKEGCDGFFSTSSLHAPPIYLLNKNLRTFFLFHLIKNELHMKMEQEGEYSTQKYARELRRLYEQIDPISMQDVEGYWSILVEEYETGLYQ